MIAWFFGSKRILIPNSLEDRYGESVLAVTLNMNANLCKLMERNRGTPV